MQRENEASSMAGQSASDVASDDQPSDSLETQRNCDESDPSVMKRSYFDDDISASRANDRRNYLKWKSDGRLSDSAKTRRVRNGINFRSMKRREESAKNRLGNLVRKRRGVPTVQLTSRYLVNQAVNEAQFRDSDNEASFEILDGPRRSASNLPETAETHDRDALIEVPIDRLHSREEAPSHLAQPTRSQDRNGVSFEAERASLNTDNLFAETPVDHANERMNDYSAHRSSRGSRASNRASERDIDAAAERLRDLAADRSDRGIVGFWVARQTHLDRRNIYALDNRSDGTRASESSADRLRESDGIVINDVRNEFTSANANDSDVNAIAIDAAAGDFDVGTVSMENQVELDGISEIENRTDDSSDYVDSSLDRGGAEIRPANCRSVACSESSDEDISVIRIKKFDKAEEGSDEALGSFYEDEDHFTRIGKIAAVPGNGSDTDVEAPFTGFEGSQKFPVKVNHKSPPVPSQVEKFDRRHFGPHKEDALEETSTWYSSTVLPDLPKSPSRDVLRRKNDGSDDVVDEDDNSGEETTETDTMRNNTYESWLPVTDVPEERLLGVKSSFDEKLAVSVADSGSQNATRDKNDSGSRAEIDVATSRSTEKINITILGLFEMTHGAAPRPEGTSELQAAKLAVERVNELNILKRFRLRLIYNDTRVSWPASKKYCCSNV